MVRFDFGVGTVLIAKTPNIKNVFLNVGVNVSFLVALVANNGSIFIKLVILGVDKNVCILVVSIFNFVISLIWIIISF